MSMHLSKIRVTEKSDSKKWKSAEHKRKAQELDAAWEQLKSKYETKTPSKKPASVYGVPRDKGDSHLRGFTPPRGHSPRIPSRPDSVGVAAKPDQKVYTGDAVMGISIVHKSCLQPVFSQEQAKDLANMRR